jgi:DNA-binding NarL/FixJ family response regulator
VGCEDLMGKRSTTRVLVVDDYKPWQDFICSMIEGAQGVEIVGRASDGLEAVQKASELQPDLILLDLGLPTLNGIEAALQIRQCAPKSRILFVSENRDGEIAEAAMAAGAVGYVVKSHAAKELLPVLHALRWSLAQNDPYLLRASQTIMYEEIVDAAAALMRSDYASMQMLYPERGTGGELRLLAFRGFNPDAFSSWEWVGTESKCSCGIALRDNRRVVAPDVATCDFLADPEVQQVYLQIGVRACQSTPLITRTGKVVGMISTLWRMPHQPSEDDFRLFDILARQAADVVERRMPHA